jgi:hypothetical protein
MSADATTDTDADGTGVSEPRDDTPVVDDDHDRRQPLGPLIALGLGAAFVIVALVVALIGGDAVSATAVRVNTFEVSQKTFNSQLRDLAPVLRDQGGSTGVTDAFVPSGVSAQLAQVYVLTEILHGHVKVSDADRRSVAANNAQELAQYSPSLRDRLVDLSATQQALVAARGQQGAVNLITRLARHADVHVDPRYGFWNPRKAEVCPPTGCTAASNGG